MDSEMLITDIYNARIDNQSINLMTMHLNSRLLHLYCVYRIIGGRHDSGHLFKTHLQYISATCRVAVQWARMMIIPEV